MDKFNILRCLLLGLTAVTGDQLVLNQHNAVRKALCDNVTHAVIGFITWINVHYYLGQMTFFSNRLLVQSLVCGVISSAIDVDHFIAAQSLHIKDATSLSKRPFLHCTTLPLAVALVLLLLGCHLRSATFEAFGWMLLASFLSHHIRDAARRGFWLWPFGSTVPLGSGLYISLTVLLPLLLSYGVIYTNRVFGRLKSHQATVSVV